MATKTTKPKVTKRSKPEENGSTSDSEEILETPTETETAEAETPKPVAEAERRRENTAPLAATLDLSGLKDMSISELTHIAEEMGVEGASGMRKQELIFKVLAAQTEKS